MAASFEGLGLGRKVGAAVRELGWERPTPVQERAIPVVLEGRDVLVHARTGSGKTGAYILPALERMEVRDGERAPRMLVVVPTRELALQVRSLADVACAHTGHVAVSVVGGEKLWKQRRSLARGCDVVVATPGRLCDLIRQGACNVGDVETLVLDEADRMLDLGFAADVRQITSCLPAGIQTLLLSATLGGAGYRELTSLLKDPVRVDMDLPSVEARVLEHYVLEVGAKEKKRSLVEVLLAEGASRVMVFAKNRHRADHLCSILRNKGFSCESTHGGKSLQARLRALARFSDGHADVLVATDVLARGIDVEHVRYVVNVDVPARAKEYVHRVGRTGRAGHAGWALTLCAPEERRALRAIEESLGHRMKPYRRLGDVQH